MRHSEHMVRHQNTRNTVFTRSPCAWDGGRWDEDGILGELWFISLLT